jgi:cytoskeleton protein RodZ
MAKRERAIQTEEQDRRPGEALSGRVLSASADPSAVGALLRTTRLRYGWDLEDVETALRIRLSHLEAIEGGRFEDLPGPAYAVGFVRAYADHLGLDREEVVARFRQEISDLPNRTQLNFPKPIPESRIPSAVVLLVAAAIAGAAYGGWYYATIGKRTPIEPVAEVPSQMAQETESASSPPATGTARTATEAQATEIQTPGQPAAAGTPSGAATQVGSAAPAAPGEQTQQVATATPSASPGTSEASPPAVPSVVPAVTEPPTPAPAPAPATSTGNGTPSAANSSPVPEQGAADESPSEEAPQPSVIVNEDVAGLPPVSEGEHMSPPQVFGRANANARIVIRANADSWVQVRDGQGQLVLTRMLRAGDSYRVPNQPGLTLLTGNAGALEIFVDGRKAPPIGPGGAIRRDVALDADRLLSGTAADY